jgi:hypothetical protein
MEIECIVLLHAIIHLTCFDDQIRAYHVSRYASLFPFRFYSSARRVVGSSVSRLEHKSIFRFPTKSIVIVSV